MKLIVMPIFDRVQYLVKCLEYLGKCRGLKDYTILASIDPSPKLPQVLQVLAQFRSKVKEIRPYINQTRLGCNGNVKNSLSWGFSLGAKELIYLEDDIALSPCAIEYFEWAANKYRENEDIFAVCAYSRDKPTELEYWQTHKRKSFAPWGTLFFERTWVEITNQWQNLNVPPIYVDREKDGQQIREKYDTYLSWDYFLKFQVRKDRYCIFPKLSRSYNFGEIGYHTPSKEFHWNKHKLEFWAGDIDLQDKGFEEELAKICQ